MRHARGSFALIGLIVLLGAVACGAPSETQPPEASPPSSSSMPAPPAVAGAPGPSTGARGLLQDVAWWNKTHPAVAGSQCTSKGEEPVGTQHAWKLPGGGLACYDDQHLNTWAGKIIGLDVYFPKGESEAAALAAARALLPADAVPGRVFPGVNSDFSTHPGGTCRDAVFTSATLGRLVLHTQPSWADASKASVALYSGHATSEAGSETTYRPTRISEALVVIGGENRGGDGVVHC